MARCPKFLWRFRPKKCIIILGCLLLFTCSIFFLMDVDSKSQKLEKIFEDGLIIKEEKIAKNPSYLLEEISELPKVQHNTVIKLHYGNPFTHPNEEGVETPTSTHEERRINVMEDVTKTSISEQNKNSEFTSNQDPKSQPRDNNHLNLYPERKIRTYNFKSAKYVNILDGGLESVKVNNKQKHLFILGHYEQLGKTTINFLEAARFAYLTQRNVVKPFVRNSRFCGLKSGWTGTLRSATRAFFPFDLYYNVSSMQMLLKSYQLAEMEYLDTFRESCSFDNGNRKIRVIYFMFEKKNSMQVLALSKEEHRKIEKSLNDSLGWIDCSFVNERIKIHERIGGNVQIGQQICVDPNRVTDIDVFENEILKNDPCVVFHQWRGIGEGRMHFNLTHLIPHEMYLRSLNPSDFVLAEVLRFMKILGTNFIGVHIRSERQLLWAGLKKFSRCMDLVYREVRDLKISKKIQKVFISADIGPFGSDQITPYFNSTELRFITKKYNSLVAKLNAVTYTVVKERHHVWTDSGLVALIQLHIMSHASNLVTLGSGTFQKWMTNTFKDRKSYENDKSWTITRTCFSEMRRAKIDRKTIGSKT